jgi:hypothetical protein
MTPNLCSSAVACPTKPRDRRAFPRRRAKGIARCRPANRPFSASVRARLVDISQGGIALGMSAPFPVAATVELELEAPAGNFRLVRQAEVRWVSPQPDGTYRLGCCFAERLNFAQMQRFV